MRIAVKHRTRIYYLRWYYEGWHYWAFRGAAETLTTTALDLKYTIQLGDDQLTKRQLNAISGLLGSKYIHLLTDDGWKQCTMNPTTFGFGSSNNIGANVTFALNVWAKVGAFTPLVLPDILPPPMLYISKYAMSFTAKQGMPSDVQTYTIKGENIISNVQINAPAGWEISSDNAAWVTGITISPIGGVVSERTIYVRMNSATVGENNAFIANTTTGVNKNIVVNGVVSEVTIKYGLLYNWYATQIQSGGQSIVNPAESANGWKVPTQSDRELLYNNAGYVLDVMNPQIKLKEAGIIYWNIGNNGENTLKLNIKGGGSREASGFVGIKNYHEIFLQTETASNIPYAMLFKLNGGTSSVYSSVKNRGAGIRLCNPTTVLTDGQVGTYTGNDGSVYRTICIESQEWLADNLVETKWSDGYTDWYLPSRYELQAIYDNLHVPNIFTFQSLVYWTSSQYTLNQSWYGSFVTGVFDVAIKTMGSVYALPVRDFETMLEYNIGDSISGGLVYHIEPLTVGYKVYVVNTNRVLSATQWGAMGVNVVATGTAIGTGKANTVSIIATLDAIPETGTAAQYCNNYDSQWIQGYDGGTYTPITDANWAALTTAALCAYDDDLNNVWE